MPTSEGVVEAGEHPMKVSTSPLNRSHFPDHFVFGTATSAYQVEGAHDEGGREPSIWDTFCRTPGKISDGSNGDVADDQYHKYLEDIDLMKQMNLDAYRFSISWTRIMTYRGSKPEVNKEGVAYYNNLIDSLLKKGITPYATLYHWDLPQTIYDEYRGWIDRRIIKDFAEYAEVCFSSFGDRVKQWTTINEPQQFSCLGYGIGNHAPGRSSDRTQSAEGNSATEPYLVVHHVLLAHATAFDLYKRKFKSTQGGTLGMTLDSEWGEALTSSQVDKEAAERFVQFQLGWFLDPIYFGDYPAVMRTILGDRLPRFTREEIALLSGSSDFVGVNHYTSRFISDGVDPQSPLPFRDREVKVSVERNGSVIGRKAASDWLYIVPWGLGNILTWITKRYNRPQLFVTENGMDDADDIAKPRPLQEMLSDTDRVAFYEDYLRSVLQSIRDGADVRGYFAWALLDNFEWTSGYSNRFGLIYVDYKNKQKRYPKTSALWYSQFLNPKPPKGTDFGHPEVKKAPVAMRVNRNWWDQMWGWVTTEYVRWLWPCWSHCDVAMLGMEVGLDKSRMRDLAVCLECPRYDRDEPVQDRWPWIQFMRRGQNSHSEVSEWQQ